MELKNLITPHIPGEYIQFASQSPLGQAAALAKEGTALMLAGKSAEAEKLLIDSLRLAPSDAAYRSLHLALCKLGRIDDALYNAYAWQSFSDRYEVLLCLAELYRKKKKYQLAIDVLADIPRAARWRKVWLCLAYCHMHASDWDAALLCLEEAEQDITFSATGTHGSKKLRTYAGYIFLYDQYLKAFPVAYRDAAFVAVVLAHARVATDWLLQEGALNVGDLQKQDYQSARALIERYPELTA